MTRKRNDSHSTEFGLWLREVDRLDSKKPYCYTASNLDLIWTNYESGLWMLLEEKRYMSQCKFSQISIYKLLHDSITDEKYKGMHLIQFENTNPEDGKIYINSKPFSTDGLIRFLEFDEKALNHAGQPAFIA